DRAVLDHRELGPAPEEARLHPAVVAPLPAGEEPRPRALLEADLAVAEVVDGGGVVEADGVRAAPGRDARHQVHRERDGADPAARPPGPRPAGAPVRRAPGLRLISVGAGAMLRSLQRRVPCVASAYS